MTLPQARLYFNGGSFMLDKTAFFYLEVIMNNIGLNILALRRKKGITQEELAKYVGVSAQAVSKWENGGVPDTELLPKIADYFEISIDVFL